MSISVIPSGHSFGFVEIGSYADRTFTVENSGYVTLSGLASVSAPFSVESGSPYSLGVSETQDVVIRLSPTEEQIYSENVTFTYQTRLDLVIHETFNRIKDLGPTSGFTLIHTESWSS